MGLFAFLLGATILSIAAHVYFLNQSKMSSEPPKVYHTYYDPPANIYEPPESNWKLPAESNLENSLIGNYMTDFLTSTSTDAVTTEDLISTSTDTVSTEDLISTSTDTITTENLISTSTDTVTMEESTSYEQSSTSKPTSINGDFEMNLLKLLTNLKRMKYIIEPPIVKTETTDQLNTNEIVDSVVYSDGSIGKLPEHKLPIKSQIYYMYKLDIEDQFNSHEDLPPELLHLDNYVQENVSLIMREKNEKEIEENSFGMAAAQNSSLKIQGPVMFLVVLLFVKYLLI